MPRYWKYLVLLGCAMFSSLYWELSFYRKMYFQHTPSSRLQGRPDRIDPSRNQSLTPEHPESKSNDLWPFRVWFGKSHWTQEVTKSLMTQPTAEISDLQLQVSHPSASLGVCNLSVPTIPPLDLTDDFPTNPSGDRQNGSKVLCMHFEARLGNQLFQYSSVLGLALGTRRIPVFLGNNLLRNVFKNTSLIDESFQYKNRCKEEHSSERTCCTFFEGFLHLDSRKDYTVGTYLQSWRYFEEHEAQIRTAVKFSDSIVSKAQQTVASLRQKYNRTLTGVHVRRADYLFIQKYGYKTAPVGYLLRAMDYVRKRFGDVVFVMCSDDVKWCHERFGNASDVVIMSGRDRSPPLDMMVLASLDHMIMTVGTYGWWASFLNPGITVYYKDFASPNSSLARALGPNGTDFYYPDWIPLS